MSDHQGMSGNEMLAVIGMAVFAIGGVFVGATLTKWDHRITECGLRYEMALTATDSLTVIREYPYCELSDVAH